MARYTEVLTISWVGHRNQLLNYQMELIRSSWNFHQETGEDR